MAEITSAGTDPMVTMRLDAQDANDSAMNTQIGNLSAALTALQATSTQFVSATTMPVATLMTNFPPSATNLGKYARVNDLYGNLDEVLRCRYDGVNYRWTPQREQYAATNNTTSGAVSLMPLMTSPVVVFAGTLLNNVTITPSATNAYIGQTFKVIQSGVLGLFGISITGLVGTGSLPLLAGGVKTMTYTAGGWVQS